MQLEMTSIKQLVRISHLYKSKVNTINLYHKKITNIYHILSMGLTIYSIMDI